MNASRALLGLAALPAAIIAAFPLTVGAWYRRFYADFGSALPLGTELALNPLTAECVAALLVGCAVAAFAQKKDRELLLGIVLVAGLALGGGLIVLMRGPLIIDAGSIK